MIKSWKHAVNSGKVFGSLLTDLSKAFDCVCHDLYLLIPILNAFGLLFLVLKRKTKNKEWILPIAYRKKLIDRSWVHFCLRDFSAICFKVLKITISQIMPMILLLT